MFNNLTIVCNLATDFQIKEGTEMAVARIASTFAKDKALFMEAKAFGKASETLATYGKKGTKMLLSGRLQMDTWEGQDGKKRSAFNMIIDKFEFINKPKDETPKPVDEEDLPF